MRNQRLSGEDLMELGMRGMTICCILVLLLAATVAVLAITGKYNLLAELAREDTRILQHALESQHPPKGR